MPAIRYPYNAVFPVATFSPGGSVCVRQKSGEWAGVQWLGFFCRHATAFNSGQYCKIQASDVTKDDGFIGSYWVSLKRSEFVLGWLVEHKKWGDKKSKWGVYAIVDDNCCPIVINDDRNDDSSQKAAAVVYNIGLFGKAG